LDERLEAHLDKRRGAAAQDGLLTEEVRLGLLREGRLEDTGTGRAERPAVGENTVTSRPGLIAMDRKQGGDAAARSVDGAQQVSGALRGDHPDIDDAGRIDPPEMDVEAVSEHQQVAGA